MSEYVIHIRWDRTGDFNSPPIGPYLNITAARKDAMLMRKALRASHVHPSAKVSITAIATPDRAWSWVA